MLNPARINGSGNATLTPGGTGPSARLTPRRTGFAITSGGFLAKYLLRLFVTGSSARSATAIANLRRICDEELSGAYELEIIDVQEYPALAEDERILATPTLIKSLPPPLRRVIGDLSDKEKVLLGLELRSDLDNSKPSQAAS